MRNGHDPLMRLRTAPAVPYAETRRLQFGAGTVLTVCETLTNDCFFRLEKKRAGTQWFRFRDDRWQPRRAA